MTPPQDLMTLAASAGLLGCINVGWVEPNALFGALFLAAAAGLIVRLLLDYAAAQESHRDRSPPPGR